MVGGILTNQAWFPDDAIIKMEPKDGTIQTFTTEVTNLSDGGGDKTTDSIAHFGGAFLVIRKPQEDFNVEFEVDVMDTTWAEVISGDSETVTGSAKVVRSGGTQNPYKIKIEWVEPSGSEAYKILYYNAYGVTFTKDNAADDRLTGTISFSVAPTDSNGSAQRLEAETLDINNGSIGSVVAGSYGSWEAEYDTIHGYALGSML